MTDTLVLDFPGTECTVYPPRQEDYEEEDNDFSLVISLRIGNEGFLFAGDCEKERLSELLAEKDLELRHQVLKVPHHGREEKNSDKFLLAVSQMCIRDRTMTTGCAEVGRSILTICWATAMSF